MALVYDDTSVRPAFRGGTPISEWGSEKVMALWGEHLRNRLYLQFMAKEGDYAERQQAHKELAICARKAAFWERHPAFDKSEASRVRHEVQREWAPGRRR